MIFFKEVDLLCTNCVGVCTDEAAAMTGHTAEFHARVRSVSDTPITFTHNTIHREALVAKKISLDLNAVVQDAVKVINFIKSRTLIPVVLQIYVTKWNQSLRLFYCIVKLGSFKRLSIKKAINAKK